MDTIERSYTERVPPTVYDGFISYSHSADDLLAPRLQAGLQKFAKPWWKRRAVRIFRDESSLAANPHLWSSITESLDESNWFILLLSEDAAVSEWVGKEIEHWVANKPSDRILPVVTDGEFGWEAGNVAGSSVPPALHGVFNEEPRWVDLRFARGDENLDLKNPEFSSAVADVASAIRGVPKDELASEEVRQHRRTVRTAWAAGIALTVLAVTALVAGIFALGQRNEARDNAALAEIEATRANQEADRANALATQEADARSEAQANAEEATHSAALARSRELSASAVNVLEEDPELSILLTLEAISQTPPGENQPAEVIDALWQAVQQDRLVRLIETGHDGNANLALSPDGSTLAVVNDGVASVQGRSTPEGELLWEYMGSDTDSFSTVAYSPDGSRIAVGASGIADTGDPARAGRVIILDAADGSEQRALAYPECQTTPMGASWSPSGTYLVVNAILGLCEHGGTNAGTWAEVLDGQTFERVALIDSPARLDEFNDHRGLRSRFDSSDRLYLFAGPSHEVTVHDPPDYASTRVAAGVFGYGDISPDESTIVTWSLNLLNALSAYDADTGSVVDHLTPVPAFPFAYGVQYTGPPDTVVTPTEGESTLVWDAETGDQLFDLRSEPAWAGVMDTEGRWLYTSHAEGRVRVWDLSPTVGFNQVGDLGDHFWVNSDNFIIGPEISALAANDLKTGWKVFFFDSQTGEFVGEPGTGLLVRGSPLVNGRFLNYDGTGEFALIDPAGGRDAVAGCPVDRATGVCLDSGEPLASDLWVSISVDGTELLKRENGVFTLIDAVTLETIGDFDPGNPLNFIDGFTDRFVVGNLDQGDIVVEARSTGEELGRMEQGTDFPRGTSDGSTLVMWNGLALFVFDTSTWEKREVSLNVGLVRGMGIEYDLRRIALGDEDGLHVFNLDTGDRLVSIPMPSVSDIHWLDEDTVLVGTNTGIWAKVPLQPEELIASAVAGVTRGFTTAECDTYRIEPCPTLDEIRSR